jgi:AcrR family transcriptional regulator
MSRFPLVSVTTAATGLRQRKKERTRQAIVDVAISLFSEKGYVETTLADIAEQAEISTSTFFNYFSSKVDIVFVTFDAVLDSARQRVLDRPEWEPAAQAVVAWLREDLPRVEAPYGNAIQDVPPIIESVPELVTEGRLRMATLEDILAEAFSRDFREPAHAVRPRVMATIVTSAMIVVWRDWFALHEADPEFDPAEGLALKAGNVRRALDAALPLVAALEI